MYTPCFFNIDKYIYINIYIYWLNSAPKTHQTQLRFCSAQADLA